MSHWKAFMRSQHVFGSHCESPKSFSTVSAKAKCKGFRVNTAMTLSTMDINKAFSKPQSKEEIILGNLAIVRSFAKLLYHRLKVMQEFPFDYLSTATVFFHDRGRAHCLAPHFYSICRTKQGNLTITTEEWLKNTHQKGCFQPFTFFCLNSVFQQLLILHKLFGIAIGGIKFAL